ncbi:hypothetical protein [Streptomyces laurentii]
MLGKDGERLRDVLSCAVGARPATLDRDRLRTRVHDGWHPDIEPP